MSFTSLPLAAFAQDEPITSVIGLALYLNLFEAMNGSPNAPRLAISAIQRLAVGEAERAVYAVPEVSSDVAAWEGMRFGFLQAGAIRVRLQHRANSAVGNARVSRLRGITSTLLAEWENGTSYVERAVDVNVLSGDAIVVSQVYTLGGSPPISYLFNIRLLTGGQDLWPGTPAQVVNNAYS